LPPSTEPRRPEPPPSPPERPPTGPSITEQSTGPSIRSRLAWSFIIILLLLLASGAANLFFQSRLRRANATLQAEAERATAALEVERASSNLLIALGPASSAEDVDYLTEAVNEASAELAAAQQELAAAIADLPPNDPISPEAITLQTMADRTAGLAELIIPAAQTGDWEKVGFYQRELLADYQRGLGNAVENIVELTEARREAATEQADTARQLALIVPSGFSLLALVAAAVTAYATTSSIVGPTRRLVEGATHLASGHLEERVPVGRQGELSQLALAFNEMADQIQASYADLERKVEERTQALQQANVALQRRAVQLEASAEIAQAITSIFNMDHLLRKATDLIRSRFGFYHAGIFLLDEDEEWLVLREATGRAGTVMKSEGHRLRFDPSSMVGWAAVHQKPRVALNVGDDSVHRPHPLLPETGSEMTLPIAIGEELLGVLDVQSTQRGAFDENDVRAVQSIADQLAVAIQNAYRVSDEALMLEAASPIFRASRRLTNATTANEVADAIINSIAETEADGCVVVEFELAHDDEPQALLYRGVWRREREPRFQAGLRLPISKSPFPMEMVSSLWTVPDVSEAHQLPESARSVFSDTGARALVNIPLQIGRRVLGQVVVLRNVPGPFSASALQLYESLSDQASVAMERVRLLTSARSRAQEEGRLRAIGDRLAETGDMESLLSAAAEEMSRTLQASGVYIEIGPRPALHSGEASPEEEMTVS
jgi:GAF domain-containing protein/HAMP domain-containing protein